MSGYLTTHVLDTARGVPAAGMRITLTRLTGGARVELTTVTTNADGRTDAQILPAEAFATGEYELEFAVGDYLAANGLPTGFLDTVPLRFTMGAEEHYHVPLLVSPFSYSTYRGS